jgi:hypothetical protein
MAERISMMESAVTPDRRLFLVLGEGSDRGDFLPDFDQDRLCYANRGVMYVVSAAQWHTAVVVLEAWDGEPPVDPDAELTEVTEMELIQGGAQLVAVMGPAVSPVLRVGPPGRYAVRVDVRGRAELLRRLEDLSDRPYGAERFTARFWPASTA